MVTFAVASDFHFPRADPKMVERFLTVATAHADYCILNGDLIEGADLGVELPLLQQFLDKALGTGCRVVFVRGNHDDCYGTELKAALQVSHPTVGLCRVYQLGPFRFVHGSHHSDQYAHQYLAESQAPVTVVGHCHRPQSYSRAGRSVHGLGCMTFTDTVPGSSQGFGYGTFYDTMTQFTHILAWP